MRIFRNIIKHRELMWVLMVREISARYRQSFLGITWAIVQPLGLTLLVVALRGVLKGTAFSLEESIKAYVAILPWTFFANAMIFATASVMRNAALLRKIYFPREVFVISAVLTSLIDFAIAAVVLVIIMAVAGHPPTIYLAFVPCLLLIEVLLALGVGLFTSACAVYKRDILYGMPFIMYFWMFVSPVLYSLDEVSEKISNISPLLLQLYLLNPMAGIIDAFRDSVLEGKAPELMPLVYAVAVTIVVLVVCYAVFKRLEVRFADVV